MCIQLSSPRRLVLRAGLNGKVVLHDAATGEPLAGQIRVELLQEQNQPAKLVVTFGIGHNVSLGEPVQVTARGESGPELEATSPSRICSRDQTAEMLAGGVDSPMMGALRSIAKHMEQTAKRVERWDHDGLPGGRFTD